MKLKGGWLKLGTDLISRRAVMDYLREQQANVLLQGQGIFYKRRVPDIKGRLVFIMPLPHSMK